MNFDENTINKIKDMINKGELNDVISQIPPEMMQNFSSMMNQNSQSSSKNSNSNSNFDFSKIDMNTILKMKSIMEKLNDSNDPRANLLKSLKPYLKESRKQKVDQYIQIFSMGKIFENFNSLGGDAHK